MCAWAVKEASEGDDRVCEIELNVIGLAFFHGRIHDLSVANLLALD